MMVGLRLLAFRCVTLTSGDETDGEAGGVVARFTAEFDVDGAGVWVLPGWTLVRIGPERYSLGAPEVCGPDQQREPVVVPGSWEMRLLARAIWRYKAEMDPQAVEHLSAALRADLGLAPSRSTQARC